MNTNEIKSELRRFKKVKKHFSVPVAVGFGISKKEHITAIAGHADIAVVGSAIIDVISKSKPDMYTKDVQKFLNSLTEH